jgi:hypothetical protein
MKFSGYFGILGVNFGSYMFSVVEEDKALVL